jgi:hypothetical protein
MGDKLVAVVTSGSQVQPRLADCIAEGNDLNALDRNGFHILAVAVEHNDHALVQFLLTRPRGTRTASSKSTTSGGSVELSKPAPPPVDVNARYRAVDGSDGVEAQRHVIHLALYNTREDGCEMTRYLLSKGGELHATEFDAYLADPVISASSKYWLEFARSRPQQPAARVEDLEYYDCCDLGMLDFALIGQTSAKTAIIRQIIAQVCVCVRACVCVFFCANVHEYVRERACFLLCDCVGLQP